MKITFKLFASLTDYLPPEARRANQVELEYDEPPTVNEVVERFALPAKSVHLVLINGAYIQPADRATRRVGAGEALAIWPPIAGG